MRPFVSLLSDEVNVRSVELTELAEHDDRVSRQLSVNARAAGPRLGKDVQKVIKASKTGDWSVGDDGVGRLRRRSPWSRGSTPWSWWRPGRRPTRSVCCAPVGSSRWTRCWTTSCSADGDVNDLLRLVQQARKDAGLQVSDRIDLTLEVSDELWAAVQARVEKVKAETLALTVLQGEVGEDRAGVVGGTVDGGAVRVAVAKAG